MRKNMQKSAFFSVSEQLYVKTAKKRKQCGISRGFSRGEVELGSPKRVWGVF